MSDEIDEIIEKNVIFLVKFWVHTPEY